MKNPEKPLWETLLKPFFQTFLIDQAELSRLSEMIDWEAGRSRFGQPDFQYPEYYQNQNFHGIEGGYLTKTAALTYDPITRYVLPPNEDWVRQALIDRIGGQPRRILDLGCGTGSMTLMLKKRFSESTVCGLDLSPEMLTIADYKAQQAGLTIDWRQGKAEKTPFVPHSFDLITITLLFHELPPVISQAVLRECFRLLIPGGQILVLDGNQKSLRQTDWLTNIFEEPYIQDYAKESIDAWLGNAQFESVQSDDVWWVHQVSQGMKPTPIRESNFSTVENRNEIFVPAI